jgi:hypothetical protein
MNLNSFRTLGRSGLRVSPITLPDPQRAELDTVRAG